MQPRFSHEDSKAISNNLPISILIFKLHSANNVDYSAKQCFW
jgi:hypothetical protein